LLKEFAGVTTSDVQRVARKHLFPDSSCLVAAGPISKSELSAILAPTSRRRIKAS
jgi:predicted Zn-dependent peptidase